MNPSKWAHEEIIVAATHHTRVWVEDPYCLLENADLASITSEVSAHGFKVIATNNAFSLREKLLECTPGVTKLIVVDQSTKSREPHLLPQDCNPGDFKPLQAPDWKPFVGTDGIIRLCIRNYLINCTGSNNWPEQVNVYPFEEMARNESGKFISAYQKYGVINRPMGTDDLLMIAASTIFENDLTALSNPIDALRIRFHSDESWQKIGKIFNAKEVESIRKKLATLPQPVGDLFSENAEHARLALVALIVLRQHFDEPGKVLPILSPSLAQYQDCTADLCTEAPSFFEKEELPRFERLLKADAKKFIHTQLGLDNSENATRFNREEHFSSVLRALVPFAAPYETTFFGVASDQGPAFSIIDLVRRFMQAKSRLEPIVQNVKSAVEKLRLIPVREQKIALYHKAFVDNGAHLLDYLSALVQSCIQDIEGPAKKQWHDNPGFKDRWGVEAQKAKDLSDKARKVLDDLDNQFGRLLEQRYSALVPAEVITTDKFYQEFMAPKRRKADGGIHKAVILLMDGMRFDWWRQLIRPHLEQRFVIDESFGLARLPSETVISRRAFFSGMEPANIRYGPESDAFSELLSNVHARPIRFTQMQERTGMAFAAQTQDANTYAGVFDFADAVSHDINWAPHKVMNALKGMLTELSAVLDEWGEDALVFITADHGHIMQKGGPVYLDGVDNAGYRSAFVTDKIQAPNAERVFQIDAKVLGHNTKGWYVFPRPGYYLRPGVGNHGRPGKGYRHGGISLFEMMIPLVALRPRNLRTRVSLTIVTEGIYKKDVTSQLRIVISADATITTPIWLSADTNDVKPVIVHGVSSQPQTISMDISPSREGVQKIRISAYPEGEIEQALGQSITEITVTPPASAVDPAVAKLKRIFGDM
jgi:hypothetical protein